MEIVFAGICCWVDSPSGTGKTVIIQNALHGGFHLYPIPPHTAYIEATETQLDLDPQKTTWESGFSMARTRFYFLDGFRITFDPAPNGGTIDITNMPHVHDQVNGVTPICAGAEEIRDGFLDSPRADAVLGLVDIPAGPVTTYSNRPGAVFGSLLLPQQPLTIVATSFDGTVTKKIYVKDGSARIYIANVDFDSRLNMQGGSEDNHQFLYCDIFRPAVHALSQVIRKEKAEGFIRGTADVNSAVEASRALALKKITLDLLLEGALREPKEFYDSLAAGCTNSQFP